MSNVNFQTVHTQTPAVERAYQTRQGQVELEQRQTATVQERAAGAKMEETQQTAPTDEAKIQLQKEQQKKRRERKKKKQTDIAEPEHEQETAEKSLVSHKKVDIRI